MSLQSGFKESGFPRDKEAGPGSSRTPVEHSGAKSSLLHRLRQAVSQNSDIVEIQGIKRIPEDQRADTHTWNNLFIWLSANLTVSGVAAGLLSKAVFGLSFTQAVLIELFFGIIAAALTSLVAIMGPKTGLRTMVIARFSVGYTGGTIFSVLNILTQLGWGVANVVLGGQLLTYVNPGSISLVTSIIIVAVCAFLPCFVGYHLVNACERYFWIPLLALLICIWGLGDRAGLNLASPPTYSEDGRSLASAVLGFVGIVIGGTFGVSGTAWGQGQEKSVVKALMHLQWAPIVADYNCRLPESVSWKKTFLLNFFGFFLPSFLALMLGSALGTITGSSYVDPYDNNVGIFLSQILSPWGGFGKVLLVLSAFSVSCINILGTYSAGLSIQALGGPFTRVPRMIWTTVGWIAYTVAGVAGRDHFSEILTSLLSVMGYWCCLLVVIIVEEHFIFRRRGGALGGYQLDAWNSPGSLPVGAAGILAFCVGGVGAVLGMSEKWYQGPIGKAIDIKFGANVGFELAILACGLLYPALRSLEVRRFGR